MLTMELNNNIAFGDVVAISVAESLSVELGRDSGFRWMQSVCRNDTLASLLLT